MSQGASVPSPQPVGPPGDLIGGCHGDNRMVTVILAAAQSVLNQETFEDAAKSVLASCLALLGAAEGYVALLDAEGDEHAVVWLDALAPAGSVGPAPPPPVCAWRNEAYRTGQAAYRNDVEQSEWARFLPGEKSTVASVLFVPLVSQGRAVGMLGLANKPGGFDPDDARVASAFAELTVTTLQRSRRFEALQATERRFRWLMESARDAILVVDGAGRVVLSNDLAERMFGYASNNDCVGPSNNDCVGPSNNNCVGQPVSRLMPDRLRQAHEDGLRRAALRQRSDSHGRIVEVTGLRSDGTEFPIELSLGSWTTKDGVFHTGILRDISDRKRAEAVREKLTHDLGERVKELNCLLGLSKLLESEVSLDAVFRGATELLPGAWQYPEVASARILLQEREYGTSGFQTSQWVQAAPIKMHGREIGCVEVYYSREMPHCDEGPFLRNERLLIDAIAERLGRIVERWRAEEDLKQAQRRLEARVIERTLQLHEKETSFAEAQRIAHLGDWEWDTATGAMRWSAELYRIFGFEPGDRQAGYDGFLSAVHPADRDKVLKAFACVTGTRHETCCVEHRVVTPGGLERTVYNRANVFRDEAGMPEKMVGIVLDLTERRALERKILTAATDEQRRIAQELHDGIGQELTAMSYLAKRLSQRLQAQKLVEAETAAELAKGLPETLARLRTIVHGLLPLEIGAEDLVPALQTLADGVRERTGILCCFEHGGKARVTDDEIAIQLYRIAQEAVGNAVRHAQARTITIALRELPGKVAMEISDDGMGIDPDAEKREGSGLHIMRYRAQAIGATLDVRGRPGGGTHIVCTLPGG